MSLKDLVIAARSPPLLRSATVCHLLINGADVASRCMLFYTNVGTFRALHLLHIV